MKKQTIFEKIVAGEIPCYKIYEDENTFAFLDIHPNNYGHTLVIPKKPYENIYKLPDEIANSLFITTKKIAIAIKKATKADGINIVMNNGSAAGQIVFHAHIHVIPRFKNDSGFRGRTLKYPAGKAEEISKKIISFLKKLTN